MLSRLDFIYVYMYALAEAPFFDRTGAFLMFMHAHGADLIPRNLMHLLPSTSVEKLFLKQNCRPPDHVGILARNM